VGKTVTIGDEVAGRFALTTCELGEQLVRSRQKRKEIVINVE
jgi:hypothetical protein